MQYLGLLVLALAPGVFWLWLIYRWDKYQPEPRGLVIRTFVMGMLVTVPVLVLEVMLSLPLMLSNIDNFSMDFFSKLPIGERAYFSFVVAGFVEEVGKFLVVRTTIYNSPYFNEPSDGIVYASAAALGFATLENISLIFTQGWAVILARGPTAVAAHFLIAVLWGYPLALRKFGWRQGNLLVWLGLLAAMVAHGLYDFFALDPNGNIWPLLPLAAVVITIFLLAMYHARRISPMREKIAEMQLGCARCGSSLPPDAIFCSTCGAKVAGEDGQQQMRCSKCGAGIGSDASYCPACGSRLVKKTPTKT